MVAIETCPLSRTIHLELFDKLGFSFGPRSYLAGKDHLGTTKHGRGHKAALLVVTGFLDVLLLMGVSHQLLFANSFPLILAYWSQLLSIC